MNDNPIDPQNYSYGVNVVDIGDARVSRGMSRRQPRTCKHARLTYDPEEKRIWCEDCEQTINPFDAFVVLVENFDSAKKRIERRASEVAEAEARALRSRAAKVMDEAWSRRSMAPACPHCGKAILPIDVVGGVGLISSELEIKRRQRKECAPKVGSAVDLQIDSDLTVG